MHVIGSRVARSVRMMIKILLIIMLGILGWQPASMAVQTPVLLVVGDSLSAEYGLPRNTGWVSLLTRRLAQTNADYRVVNASISGETTIGGRSRLPALLERHKPTIVVIELGANDALRGLSLKATQENLLTMVRGAKGSGAEVLLIGMQMPPNYGKAYGERFKNVFVQVAQKESVKLVPFLLTGFETRMDYFQADRVHPNTHAQPYMLETVWRALQPTLSTQTPPIGGATPVAGAKPG